MQSAFRCAFYSILGICLSVGLNTWAAEVSQVKGKSILIDAQGDSLSAGEKYFVLDLAGKRKAIVQISKVKGDKAIGKVLKGNAQSGMTLAKSTGGASPNRAARQTEEPAYDQEDPYAASYPAQTGSFRMAWGGMVGFASDSLTADIVTDAGVKQGSASTTGMGFSANGLFDYELFDQVWFRGLAGLESFKTSGPAQCGETADETCDVNLMFLNAAGIGRYLFSMGDIRPWVGGGVSILFPMSKSSSLLRSSSITSTYAFLFTGGVDWKTSPTMYIPLSIEYGMLPNSDTVKSSWIQVRGGLAFPF